MSCAPFLSLCLSRAQAGRCRSWSHGSQERPVALRSIPLCPADAWGGQGTAFLRSSPTREFPDRQEVQHRSLEAPCEDQSQRAIGRAPICTTRAGFRGAAKGSRSTKCTRPCYEVWACSRPQLCVRLACQHTLVSRAFASVCRGAFA